PADIGQLAFALVVDVHAEQVVPARGGFELTLVGVVEEVGHEHDDGASREDLVEKIESGADAGAGALGLGVEDLLDDAEDVRLALAERDEALHLVGEQDEGDAVVVLERAEGEGGRDLGGELALAAVAGAEQSGGADVD